MANRSLGTPQNSKGEGLDAPTHRQIIKALYPNTGVITGLTVKGQNTLTYHIDPGVGVASRGGADGNRIYYYSGGDTPTISPADAANPRIDTIWIKPQDPTTDNDLIDVTAGVTQGTPATNPTKPNPPAACTALAWMRLPAGAATTSGAVLVDSQDYAIPYGSGGQLLGENVNTADSKGDSRSRVWYYENPVTFTVPTDRTIELEYECTVSNSGGDWLSWGVGAFQIDGRDIPHSGTEWLCYAGVWETHQVKCVIQAARGTHTVRVRNGKMNGSTPGVVPSFHYGVSNGVEYQGRTLRVWDRGVAR